MDTASTAPPRTSPAAQATASAAPRQTREEIVRGLLATRDRLRAERDAAGTSGHAPASTHDEVQLSTPSVAHADAQPAPAPESARAPVHVPEPEPAAARQVPITRRSDEPKPAAPAGAAGAADPYREPIEDTPRPEPTPAAPEAHLSTDAPAAPAAVPEESVSPDPVEYLSPESNVQPAPQPAAAPASSPAPGADAASGAAPQRAHAAAPVAPVPPAAPEVPAADAALMTPEVSAGLEQLLSEWDIFKSSGFLGFGGSGIDHPTYQQLAGMPVSAVASGAWEDADPAVVQNINEYVEGWTREQGVAPEPQETFERYLRRVIAHILKQS